MSDSSLVYTYRAGRKVALEKEPDRFVVRALPGRLRELGLLDAEQVSSGSSRVTTSASELESAMSRSRELAPTHHAYRLAETGGEYLVTDRVLVTFREALGPEQVDAFAARYGLVRKASYGARDHLFQLTDHTGMNPVKLVVRLTEEEPLVEGAENDLNQRMKTYAVTVPTDPSYVAQWHLHTRRQHPQFDARSSSGCEAAWQRLDGFGSADVVVGVTDDGCKLDHPDFDSPGKFAGWGYFRGERLVVAGEVDAAPADMYQAGSNHGTSCAGVIGGEVDAVLTVGAAPGCRLLPIRWESSGPYLSISDSKLLTALGYVADKVDVLSNSWGGAPTSIWSSPVVRRITELARTGGAAGPGHRVSLGGGERELSDRPSVGGRGALHGRVGGAAGRVVGVGGGRHGARVSEQPGGCAGAHARRGVGQPCGAEPLLELRDGRPDLRADEQHPRVPAAERARAGDHHRDRGGERVDRPVRGHFERHAPGGRHRRPGGFREPGSHRSRGGVDSRADRLQGPGIPRVPEDPAGELRSDADVGRVAGRAVRPGGVRGHRGSGRHVESVVRAWAGGRFGGGAGSAAAAGRRRGCPGDSGDLVARAGDSGQRSGRGAGRPLVRRGGGGGVGDRAGRPDAHLHRGSPADVGVAGWSRGRAARSERRQCEGSAACVRRRHDAGPGRAGGPARHRRLDLAGAGSGPG
jgi:hypothetical protein